MKTLATILVTCMVLALPATIGAGQDVQIDGKNIEALLREILANQQKMQAEIDMLKQRLDAKDSEIEELKESKNEEIESLKEQLSEQKKVAEENKAAIANTEVAPAGDMYAARLQYEVARNLMHDVIFEIRKGEQGPWFERVIEEFRKVLETNPNAPEADDAQFRIAKIYWRYLDSPQKAIDEFQALIDNYPQSRYVPESRESIADLK